MLDFFSMNKQNIVSLGIVVLLLGILVGGIVLLTTSGKMPKGYQTELTKLAQCLTDKGAKFYGTYWCPHCANQKKAFGKAAKDLPYIECALPGVDRGKQTPECEAVTPKIDGYPTWIFADGTRMSGEIKPEKLAAKVGCPFVASTSDETSLDEGVTSPATE